MYFKINEIAKKLKIKSPDLITRPVGRSMYKKICKKIENVNDGETIVIDFDGIKVIDSSFIDECIIKLIMDSIEATSPFFIKIKNITDVAEINIRSVLESYATYDKRRMVVITEDIRSNNSFFIGSLQTAEKDLLDYIRINSIVSLKDLQHFTQNDTGDTQAIIEKLFSMRIIRKIDTNTYSRV